ncbi:Protein monoglycylase ttll8 [Aphanomyces cochlioides]|nr:Protein monoglycylase ttll8 [Aphanomyces cochlioides]
MLSTRFMHLCNNSIQKASDTPNHPEIPGHMWNLERFQLHLSELGQGNAWEYLICPAMQHACVEAILAVDSKLKRIGNGFEWLGLDFLLDANLTPWLLEVNVSPDVSHSTQTTAELVPKATGDMLALVLGKASLHEKTGGWKLLYQQVSPSN